MPRVWPYYLVMLSPGQRHPMSSACFAKNHHIPLSLFLISFWCFIFLSHAVFCQPFAATPIIFVVFGFGDHDDVIKWKHFPRYCMAICAGNSPVTGEFPAQRPVMRCFVVFFDLRLNKRLSKQSWDWWFETPPRPLWRHCNVPPILMFPVCSVQSDYIVWFVTNCMLFDLGYVTMSVPPGYIHTISLGCVCIGQLWLW